MFSFSSSPFSVTMDRIEKCAARSNISNINKNEENIFVNLLLKDLTFKEKINSEDLILNIDYVVESIFLTVLSISDSVISPDSIPSFKSLTMFLFFGICRSKPALTALQIL